MESTVDIFASLIEAISGNVSVVMNAFDGNSYSCTPAISYIFGDAQYIKDQLDLYSQNNGQAKLPLVALFTPCKETRGEADCEFRTTASLIIACSTKQEWTNDERLDISFKKVLRPIYNALLEAIRKSSKIELAYDGSIPHEYSENYSYGRYGAYTAQGDALSEPIDAINIGNLKLKIKKNSCKR